jgi:long-chain acyl-CoA synthetase
VNIADNLDRSARQFPDHPAIIFEDRQLTYRQLREQVDRVAHGLLGRGIRVGDRVALYLPNIPEFAIVYLAAQKIGAVAVAVNSMLTSEEVRYVVDDSGARLLFTTAAMLPKLQGFLGDGLADEQVIVCEGQATGFDSLGALGAGDYVPLQPLALEPRTPAAILYTSGTTGQQKGATLSHGNVVANVTQTLYCLRTRPDDRLLLFHCFGQNFIMNTGLAAGATLVLHRRPRPCRSKSPSDGRHSTVRPSTRGMD